MLVSFQELSEPIRDRVTSVHMFADLEEVHNWCSHTLGLPYCSLEFSWIRGEDRVEKIISLSCFLSA